MTIGDLTYSLGAVWDKESLRNIREGFASVAKTFAGAIAVTTGAMAGIFGVVKEFAGANDELGKLARNKDIAVDTLQAMQYSFKGAGLEASKVGDVLGELQKQKEGFKTGKADYEAFARIGINPTQFKNNEDYFNAVIDGLGNIKDEATKSDLAKRLLGSADMKNLIDGGSEAIKKQKKELEELGVLVSNQDYKASADFNDTLLHTTTVLKGLANKVMTSIMPIFTKLMKSFNAFIKANKELISSGLRTFLDAIINGSQFFLSLIGRVVEHLGGLKVVIAGIAGLILLWQFPLIATIAIAIALMLIFDDIMNFFKGNDSVIGDWINAIKASFEDFKNSFPNLGAIVQAQLDTVIAIFTYFKDTIFNIWDLFTGKISFGDFLGNQVEIVADLLGSVKDLFSTFIDSIVNMFADLDLFGAMGKQIDSITNGVSSFLGFSSDTPQAQPVPIRADSNTTSQTSNTYHISATVDAKTKNISEAISEIANPNGY